MCLIDYNDIDWLFIKDDFFYFLNKIFYKYCFFNVFNNVAIQVLVVLFYK